jgi:hypothetical protein
MKKEELITQLETTKALSSQVDIDKVIVLIKQLETTTLTPELGSEIVSRIERCLESNNDDLVDLDSAEFELAYDNRIELNRVDINVYNIMEHVTSIVDEYVVEPEEEDTQVEAYNENSTEQVDGFIEAQREAE